MHDIQNKLLATREKVTEINRLKEEIENIWNPLYNDREKTNWRTNSSNIRGNSLLPGRFSY